MIKKFYSYLILLILLSANKMLSQCPQVYDGLGTPSSTPVWVSCTGGAYTLNFASPNALSGYTIDWGDGSAVTSGASLAANTIVPHNYAATIDTFILVLTTTTPACTINGLVVMEKPVNASIQIPVGGVTTSCAPASLQFTNSSTDVSATTVFTWDFGDGSPIQTFNEGNAGQTITHVYQRGTVNCQTIVTLTAENYCSFGNPTSAQFNPIQIYDIDEADITADAYIKCWPDNSFTFTNATTRNCVPQGNVDQRYEYWNFGNYWGQGHDSILNWGPWPPSLPRTIAYPGVGNYNIMLLDSNRCGIDTVELTVSIVNPPTAGVLELTDTVCAGGSITFNNTSSTGYTYQWNFGDAPGFSTTGFGPRTHTYNNPGTYTVTVVALILGSAASCSDTAHTVVTILPNPVSSFVMTPDGMCDEITVNFTDASTSAIAWQWNFGNSNNSSSQTPPAQTYTVGTYTVSLKVTAANTCQHTSSQVVHVYQSPTAGISVANACVNSTVNFTDTSTAQVSDPVISWDWDFDDSGSSALQNPSHVYSGFGTFDVELIANTAHCSDTVTQAITINPLPVAGFTKNPGNGCSPLPVAFTNTSTGAETYSWNLGNGITSTNTDISTVFINQVSDSIYQVSLIAITSFGCRDTVVDSVEIFGKPQANFNHSSVAGCAPVPVVFTNASLGAATYEWDFGTGQGTSLLVDPTHTFVNATSFVQAYDVTLIATSMHGCKDTLVEPVTINPQPLFGFTMVPDTGCSVLNVNFPAVAGAVLYEWDLGDNTQTTGSSPSHSYTNPGLTPLTFTVQLIATNAFNCKDTTEGILVVNPKPTAGFTASQTTGCPTLGVNLVSTSVGASSYVWNFGDSTPEVNTASTSHGFDNTSTSASVTYPVKLLVENTYGCKDSITQNITVNPAVKSDFTATVPTCAPVTVQFNNNSQGAASYHWDFDNTQTSSATNPSQTFDYDNSAQLVYDVQLIATSSFNCRDTMTVPVTVNPKPAASYTASQSVGCPALGVNFTNTSVGSAGNTWSFGDGSPNTNALSPFHSFDNTSFTLDAIYNVKLVVENGFGCKDSITAPVTVYPMITASFTADTPICSPINVQFFNLSQGAASYHWDLGDGTFSTVATPNHSYQNNGPGNAYAPVILTATSADGCTDMFAHNYVIFPTPEADFTASPLSQLYPATTVTLGNSTPNAAAFTNTWYFGDSQTSAMAFPVSHNYATWGTYTISLVVNSPYCKDSTSKTIEIIPPVPIAAFKGSKKGCRSLTVNFQSTSQYESNYLWKFGDGNTSNLPAPTHTYNTAGVYDIELIVTGDGGSDTIKGIDSVTVYELPQAAFIASPLTVNAQTDPVIITNISVSPDGSPLTYHFDFGDGTVETSENPSHVYTDSGSYEITMIAMNTHSCVDTFTFSPLIRVDEKSSFEIPNAFTPNPNGGSADGIYDPFAANNDIFHPVVRGVKNYELSIYSRWGELLFETKDTKVGWDGYYKGKMCTQDVYIWKIKATTVDNKNVNKAGDFLLLKQ